MRLHANAALSLTQPRRMVRLVIQSGWSVGDGSPRREPSSAP
jgi:hypothetical protein